MKTLTHCVAFFLVLFTVACQPASDPEKSKATQVPESADLTGQSWHCRNTLEITCDGQHCEAADSFTPMSLTFNDAGTMSICAYSGCSEGTGTVTRSGQFLILTGHRLPFSTSPDDRDRRSDAAIIVDTSDQVALLKLDSFAHPFSCQTSDNTMNP